MFRKSDPNSKFNSIADVIDTWFEDDEGKAGEDNEIAYTDVVCKLFDLGTCKCSDYANRQTQVPDCLQLTPENLPETTWLPPTCAYKLIADKQDLPWWHPLVSGSDETVIEAGISVMSRVLSETDINEDDLIDHVVIWPYWPETNGEPEEGGS